MIQINQALIQNTSLPLVTENIRRGFDNNSTTFIILL